MLLKQLAIKVLSNNISLYYHQFTATGVSSNTYNQDVDTLILVGGSYKYTSRGPNQFGSFQCYPTVLNVFYGPISSLSLTTNDKNIYSIIIVTKHRLKI